MALTVKAAQSIKPGPGLGTHSHPSITFKEAAGQTFIRGCPVVFTSGGSTVEEDTTDPVAIVGVAEEDASGTTNDDVRVVPAIPGLLFEGILGNGDLTDYTLLAADVGDVYGLGRDGTNKGWFVDKQETAIANIRVRVMGLKDPAGTVNGRVYFTFLTFVQNTATSLVTPVTVWAHTAAA